MKIQKCKIDVFAFYRNVTEMQIRVNLAFYRNTGSVVRLLWENNSNVNTIRKQILIMLVHCSCEKYKYKYYQESIIEKLFKNMDKNGDGVVTKEV